MVNTNYGPAYQHTHSAVRYLVKGDGDIRQRLKEAWGWAMILNRADVVIPESIREEVDEMHALWEQFPEPRIENAVEGLTSKQCEDEAMKIVHWLCSIVEARHEARI